MKEDVIKENMTRFEEWIRGNGDKVEDGNTPANGHPYCTDPEGLGPALRFDMGQINDFFRAALDGDRWVFRKAAVAVSVSANFESLIQVKQVLSKNVTRNLDGSFVIKLPPEISFTVPHLSNQTDISPAAKLEHYLAMLRERGINLGPSQPIFGPIHNYDLGLVGAEVAGVIQTDNSPENYDERSFRQPETHSDHDYGAVKVEPLPAQPEVVIKEEAEDWSEVGAEEIVSAKAEPHPDENQVISFLDSLLATKKKEAAVANIKKEVGCVAGNVSKDKIIPKVELNGQNGGTNVLVVNTNHPRSMLQNPRVLPALTPQNASQGSCITAKFVDGEFTQSCKFFSSEVCRFFTVI